ncbi:hypothetical protein ONS95_014560 [Cadophora gregata]|uniref:uncharacterized protein n=1 Tax=Cadophora gregata TaxID=51156 RepID=UPI0026DCC248|nr:uncharacterized protein ONS95_014560 [Cadophora gregata]KAK0112833.1 hypothetical protein ONS95_014560 [Cadophora gregata]
MLKMSPETCYNSRYGTRTCNDVVEPSGRRQRAFERRSLNYQGPHFVIPNNLISAYPFCVRWPPSSYHLSHIALSSPALASSAATIRTDDDQTRNPKNWQLRSYYELQSPHSPLDCIFSYSFISILKHSCVEACLMGSTGTNAQK